MKQKKTRFFFVRTDLIVSMVLLQVINKQKQKQLLNRLFMNRDLSSKNINQVKNQF